MNNYPACSLIDDIEEELKINDNKISEAFIDRLAKRCEEVYLHPTLNMRLCILKLPTGHEVLGKAQVLDMMNDVEEVGNRIAYQNAVNELWGVVGTLAKAVMCR